MELSEQFVRQSEVEDHARLRVPAEERRRMEIQKYCVYNQTSESFLSLEITAEEGILTYLKGMIANRSRRFEVGHWAVRPKGSCTFGLLSARDLISLDEYYRVIHVVESFPALRVAEFRPDAASVLTLPVHTIDSTQTRPGHQLVICVAEEMEFRLNSTSNLPPSDEMKQSASAMEKADPLKKWLSFPADRDRRLASREDWPRMVAYDWTGDALEVNGISDFSSTGLYLLTEKRWPLGSQIMMTLQRTEAVDENAEHAITVQLRVTRWGKDGVGLMFDQPVAADGESTLKAACAK